MWRSSGLAPWRYVTRYDVEGCYVDASLQVQSPMLVQWLSHVYIPL